MCRGRQEREKLEGGHSDRRKILDPGKIGSQSRDGQAYQAERDKIEVSLLLSRPCYGDEELYNICLLWIDMWIDLTRMAPIKPIRPPTRCERRDDFHQGDTPDEERESKLLPDKHSD